MNILKKSLLALALTGMSSFALAAVKIGAANSDIKITATGSLVTTACEIDNTAKNLKMPKVSTAVLGTVLAAPVNFEMAVTKCDAQQLDVSIVDATLKGKFLSNTAVGATAGEGAVANVAIRNVQAASTAGQIAIMAYTAYTDLSTVAGSTKTIVAGVPDVAAPTEDQKARGKIYMQLGYIKDGAVAGKAGNFTTKFSVRVNYK